MKRQRGSLLCNSAVLSRVLAAACLLFAAQLVRAENRSTQPPSEYVTEWWLHSLPLLHDDDGRAVFVSRSPQAVLVIGQHGEIASVHSIETGDGFTPEGVTASDAATLIDNRLVCVAPGRSILSVNIKNGVVIKRAEKLTAPVASLAYDSKTRTLLAGLQDGTAVAFEVEGKKRWKTKWRLNPPQPEDNDKHRHIHVAKWVAEGTFCVLGKGVRIVRASTGECLGVRLADQSVGPAFAVEDGGVVILGYREDSPKDLIVNYFNHSGDLVKETAISGSFCCPSVLPSSSELFFYSENEGKLLRLNPRTGEIHAASTPRQLDSVSVALKLRPSEFLLLQVDHLFFAPLQFSPGR